MAEQGQREIRRPPLAASTMIRKISIHLSRTSVGSYIYFGFFSSKTPQLQAFD